MNEVERVLSRARRRQRRKLKAGAGIVLAAVLAGATLLFMQGIGRIEVAVLPADAAAGAVVEIVEGRGVVWRPESGRCQGRWCYGSAPRAS